jgi:hypothetical protein
VATQSLAYIDEQLAFVLSRLYFTQQEYLELTRGMLQAMYVRPPTENEDVFLGALSVYYGDIVLIEARLLQMYDDLDKQIARALSDSQD